MAAQDRAIRTRKVILSAAAKVFEERGYQATTIAEILAAASVTKGALYFHFQSKEDLAQGVLVEQDQKFEVPRRAIRVQQLVDTVFLHCHRLQTDPLVRAAVRLSLDLDAVGLDRAAAFSSWTVVVEGLIVEAAAQGEVLPHVVPTASAGVFVGSFAGIQQMSQVMSDYADLPERISDLLRHLLPSMVLPSVLASLELSPGRGVAVYEEVQSALATTGG